MPRRDPVESTLERLAAIRHEPTAPASLTLLRKVLAGRSSHAAAKAAEIAGENEMEALVPELVAAFGRYSENAVKTDPGCAAKTAIADALYRIGAAEVALYLKGIRYVQLEPVWGGKADTATDLRGTCGHALVRIGYHDYLGELAELLADREIAARRAAAQALAYSENPAAIPILRLKCLLGDEEPQVLGDCLLAVLKIGHGESISFVERFLARPADAEAAALALGSARLLEAFPVLKQWCEQLADTTLRRSGLLAIAMLKSDDALSYLLNLAAEAEPLEAREAISALAIYRHDDNLTARLESILKDRHDTRLLSFFRETFLRSC